MRDNYAPWNTRIEDFWKLTSEDDKLRFLIRFAILAPSTHNSQPWKFHINGTTISILPNLDRSLKISDPHNRHLFISLGCALENLIVAGEYYGYWTAIDDLKITFTRGGDKKGDSLTRAILERRSNRSAFENRTPDQAIRHALSGLASDTVSITLVTDQSKRHAISDMISRSRNRAFGSWAFRNELADYKRSNFTHSPTGMPGFTMGFSTFMSLFTAPAIRLFNIMKIVGKSEDALFRDHTPMFGVVSTPANERNDWITAGRMVQRLLLTAESYGVHSSLCAVPPNTQELQAILDATARPQLIIRMGYTENIPGHSPRYFAHEVSV